MNTVAGIIVVAFIALTGLVGWSQGRIYEHWQLRTNVQIGILKKVLVIALSILLVTADVALIYRGVVQMKSGGISMIAIGVGGLVIYLLFFFLSARRVENKVSR